MHAREPRNPALNSASSHISLLHLFIRFYTVTQTSCAGSHAYSPAETALAAACRRDGTCFPGCGEADAV